MKTTIDAANSLLKKAKRIVRQARPFKLKRHVFTGKGLRPEVEEGGWRAIRDLIYRLG